MKSSHIYISIFFLFFSFIGKAKNIYVSRANLVSSQDGSVTNPFSSVQFAIDMSAPGDHILIKEGSYEEVISINKDSLVITNFEEDEVKVVFPSSNSLSLSLANLSGNYVQIRNIRFVGGNKNTLDVIGKRNVINNCSFQNKGKIVVVRNTADLFTISNSDISGGENGLGIESINSSRLSVVNCYIHHVGGAAIQCRAGSSDGVIEQNLIVSCNQGIVLGGDSDESLFDRSANEELFENISMTVRNNIVSNCTSSGVALIGAIESEIYNNTLVDVAQLTGAGVLARSSNHGATVVQVEDPIVSNNIVVLNKEAKGVVVWIDNILGDPLIDYNLYYGQNKSKLFFSTTSLGLIGWRQLGFDQYSVNENPMLDETYHLREGSPAIDKGTSEYLLPNDYDWQPRGGLIDIGADEFNNGAMLVIPPVSSQKGTGGGQIDCNGVVNGKAFMDQCDQCVGGATKKEACLGELEEGEKEIPVYWDEKMYYHFVKIKQGKYKVLSSRGDMVRAGEIQNNGRFDYGSLPPGQYILRITKAEKKYKGTFRLK